MNRIGTSIALLFSAVSALYLVILFNASPPDAVMPDEMLVKPTYRAINLNSKLYDDDGKLSHQVKAQQMEHYQSLGFMVFDQPIYTVFLDDSEPWQITAEEGTLYENSRIQLERNVQIVNLNKADYVQTITTQYIEINLENKTLLSDQPVTISGDAFKVQSIGIQGNLSTQKYMLMQHVQSTFRQ